MSTRPAVAQYVLGKHDENASTIQNGHGQVRDRRGAQQFKISSRKGKQPIRLERATTPVHHRATHNLQRLDNDFPKNVPQHDTLERPEAFDTDVGSDFDLTVTSLISNPQSEGLLDQTESHSPRGYGTRQPVHNHEPLQHHGHQQGFGQYSNGFHESRQPTGRFDRPDHLIQDQNPQHESLVRPLDAPGNRIRTSRKRDYSHGDILPNRQKDTFDGTDGGVEDDSESVLRIDGNSEAFGSESGPQTPSRPQRVEAQGRTHKLEYIQTRREEIAQDFNEAPCDYTPKQLKDMSFAQLTKRPWDTSHEQSPDYSLPEELAEKTVSERIDHFVMKALQSSRELSTENHFGPQIEYYKTLNPTEWEEAGDHLLFKFGELLQKIKQAKADKRRVLEELERELEERESKVRGKSNKLDRELETMAVAGEGLLRGKR